jgi:cobalt/nickel transport system permease protein
LLVGVLTILFSVTQQPQHLLVGIPLGSYWLGVLPEGLTMANTTFWRSLAALAATFWLVLNLPFPQLIVLLRKGECRVC